MSAPDRIETLVAAIRAFLDSKSQPLSAPSSEIRLSRAETDLVARSGAGAGTSGVAGIQTTTLYGDPTKPGPYAIELRVPANTSIAPHSHRDNRSATVVSGTWYFAYGTQTVAAPAKQLTQGSFYTEPGGSPHFAFTRDEPAVVLITGVGPTDTVYVDAKAKTPAPSKSTKH